MGGVFCQPPHHHSTVPHKRVKDKLGGGPDLFNPRCRFQVHSHGPVLTKKRNTKSNSRNTWTPHPPPPPQKKKKQQQHKTKNTHMALCLKAAQSHAEAPIPSSTARRCAALPACEKVAWTKPPILEDRTTTLTPTLPWRLTGIPYQRKMTFKVPSHRCYASVFPFGRHPNLPTRYRNPAR